MKMRILTFPLAGLLAFLSCVAGCATQGTYKGVSTLSFGTIPLIHEEHDITIEKFEVSLPLLDGITERAGGLIGVVDSLFPPKPPADGGGGAAGDTSGGG